MSSLPLIGFCLHSASLTRSAIMLMLHIKLHTNWASSYCKLTYKWPSSKLSGQCCKMWYKCAIIQQWFDTLHSQQMVRRDIIMLTGCIDTEVSNAGDLQ